MNMNFFILEIPQANINACIIAISALIVSVFFIYLTQRPKKTKIAVEKWREFGTDFVSDINLTTEDDFVKYVKHCAYDAGVDKKHIMRFLIGNKYLLLSTYMKRTKRELYDTDDMSHLFAKVERSY